ncbi:hypothetical protein [Butyrivibrio sp. TB]|uniref:hypothetical protein n=1 Tax=Butyrivibrio sp. TB TaxID=1520809 RepID=UPI0008D34C06|nr:hypothetical protein [Butyrivibrio sp. TB]SEQ04027.1 hypothetical protein SAMN02910382_01782 [Butyrivibrio sp. TB]
MRSINDRFIRDLLEGDLSFFLQQVKNRKNELTLEIRKNYINIYFRGGNLLRIIQNKASYTFEFNARYCLNKGDDHNYEQISKLNPKSVDDYIKTFDLRIREMEKWLDVNHKAEREYQHQLLIHNPSIIDIEYQIKRVMRLDMLMIRDRRLVLVENKYGTGAISGKASLAKHYNDICSVLQTEELRTEVYDSVDAIIGCKKRLGLMSEAVHIPDRNSFEILFLFADFNSKSLKLKNEIEQIKNRPIPANIIINSADDYILNFDRAKNFFKTEQKIM